MPSNEQSSPITLTSSISSAAMIQPNYESLIESLLALPSVRCKDPAKVKSLILRILQDGAEKLQVISDFDRTLTKYFVGGSEGKSSYGVLEDGTLMSPDYRREAGALRDKYYPIEIDPHMEEADKIPYMVEWWEKANQLMIRYKLNYNHLCEVVRHSDILLREHCREFFDRLHELSVPLLILSGGLTQIIEEVFKSQADVYSNMHIVANTLSFDENGDCNGLKGKLIHVFNKSEAAVHDSPYFSDLQHRNNAILMGDMIADLHMGQGLPNREQSCVLKIGFLNVKENELMDRYLDAFDIVLVSDPGLDFVYSILQNIK